MKACFLVLGTDAVSYHPEILILRLRQLGHLPASGQLNQDVIHFLLGEVEINRVHSLGGVEHVSLGCTKNTDWTESQLPAVRHPTRYSQVKLSDKRIG